MLPRHYTNFTPPPPPGGPNMHPINRCTQIMVLQSNWQPHFDTAPSMPEKMKCRIQQTLLYYECTVDCTIISALNSKPRILKLQSHISWTMKSLILPWLSNLKLVIWYSILTVMHHTSLNHGHYLISLPYNP